MGTYQTVLVGTDGSDSSFRAVDRAAELARDAAAKLVIVCAYHAAGEREVAAAGDALGDAAYQVVGSSPAEETLRTAAERAAKAGATDVETSAVSGDPVKTLISSIQAHRADLLVVGNRGLNTLAGRLLGSVPSDVSRHARCDVLIVHTVR
ncbi:MAG TPA: universal stress protein [Pseudonocardiaceae bacterium]|jgi:nucleotide-binding universal stress UspA family protein|nr:universal stress protein [Pseudonocardiaceae bacterium]